ncbi:hypothetical protein H6G36_29165 [Anabaena minutissima FACHB-250]|nr:hypothetical protein [Anabaena minutissima FACHB-250]
MYLTELLIENIGPINFIDLSLPFHDDGNPKPVILVGTNGSGKSIFLSYIVDALTEFAKSAYSDIVPIDAQGLHPYFKMVSPTNQRIGSDFGIALLQFIINKNNYYSYIEKTGLLDCQSYSNKRRQRFESVSSWNTEGNYKECHREELLFRTAFKNNVISYFPASRREIPHWLNVDSISNKSQTNFGSCGSFMVIIKIN